MTSRQYHHRRADLELARAGKRVRHSDERVDRFGVHQLGEPQRIDAEGLDAVDDVGQLRGSGIGTKTDTETDLHRRSRAVVVHPFQLTPYAVAVAR